MKEFFEHLKSDFPVPLIIVQHLSPDSDSYLPQFLDKITALKVKEADEKEILQPGFAYVAPPNYHLLLEGDATFTLTVEERVNYARPSIDVLFETAAEALHGNLIGIVLTGANHDGSHGLKKIKELGGMTIVQDPQEAESPYMPRSAISHANPEHIMKLKEIVHHLNTII